MRMLNALLALLAIGFVFAGLSISDYSISPETVEPGDYGVLEITVSNPSGTGAVESVVLDVSSATQLGIDRQYVVGDLEAGASTIITVPFEAEEGIPSRIYTVNIIARGISEIEYYSETSGTFRTSTETVEKMASVPIEVVEKPILGVGLTTENLGDLTECTFVITNSGGPAEKVRISIDGGFGFLHSDQLYVGDAGEYAEAAATIDARSAEEGAGTIAATVTYTDELGNGYSETRSIPVTVTKDEGNFAFVQDGAVVTGREETLVLTITNEGKAAKDVKFHFSDDDVLLRGMNEVRVGDLAEGESMQLSVPLVADLEPGTNNVDMIVEWMENGEDKVGTITFPLKVNSDAEVGVYFEASPSPLSSGSEHTLSVTVSNLGSYSIEGVTVHISSDAFRLLTVQPEQYIGGLQTDDFSSVQYGIMVNRVEAGEHPVDVTVKYKDPSGNWVTEEKQLTVLVEGGGMMEADEEQDSGFSISPVSVAIVLVVAGITYWGLKRFRKKPAAR